MAFKRDPELDYPSFLVDEGLEENEKKLRKIRVVNEMNLAIQLILIPSICIGGFYFFGWKVGVAVLMLMLYHIVSELHDSNKLQEHDLINQTRYYLLLQEIKVTRLDIIKKENKETNAQ